MRRIVCVLLVLCLFCGAALAQGLTEFTTYGFDTNTYTEAIFADYDLTIVNVWATWCGWCKREMPDFPALKAMLPENMNLITICMDGTTETIEAYEILKQCDALDIVTLLPTREMYDRFLYQVAAYPTTFFLDRNGNVLGDPIVGVPTMGDDYAETYCACATELWDRVKDL